MIIWNKRVILFAIRNTDGSSRIKKKLEPIKSQKNMIKER